MIKYVDIHEQMITDFSINDTLSQMIADMILSVIICENG